ncbi:ClpXP protease specificity-enhancing factor [Aliamphritea hakodatensis]|uniref:ClpXP protease specificity-enhancing factor n=1 Tax=Aliamphritea hakodatensis TaxID=2895352 RepID=UPI0022FD9826|nr:ClpXP protease specificity-enhancing factor [Aliamphritea hakodatensis]
MNPSRPYLVRALQEWILDNSCTPHLAVDAHIQGVVVPTQFVQDGQIVLNISPSAVQNLYIDDDGVSFNARFGGVPMNVYVPMVAIMAVYARENGQGMGFGMEPGAELYERQAAGEADAQAAEPVEEAEEKPKRPSLKVVK